MANDCDALCQKDACDSSRRARPTVGEELTRSWVCALGFLVGHAGAAEPDCRVSGLVSLLMSVQGRRDLPQEDPGP